MARGLRPGDVSAAALRFALQLGLQLASQLRLAGFIGSRSNRCRTTMDSIERHLFPAARVRPAPPLPFVP